MNTKSNLEKSIIIIGPTASGKSDLAIQIAQKRNGEVISVDSRQIYRGLDIGTGKISKIEQALVPHHLLDICEPEEEFNVSAFVQKARTTEEAIRNRGRLPIFCGGSLFWVESYVKNSRFPAVAPNQKLREELFKETPEILFTKLQMLDPKRAAAIDPKNKIRLIRALEIIESLGQVPALISNEKWKTQFEIIILNPESTVLRECIEKRLSARLNAGMIKEVESLLAEGVSHEWLQKIGLEYKYVSLFLLNKLSGKELENELLTAIWHYAKRQKTFLKRFT